MYSQHEEEKIITEYFAGTPACKFYDIGAWNGSKFSNTWALMEKGWGGVMVEPSPTAFAGLLVNTAPFKERLELVNVAITEAPALVKFYDSEGDAVSTLSDSHRAKWEPYRAMRPFWTNSLPARLLFDTFGDADFISLDVEGTNAAIFKLLPLAWPRLKMVCVEHDDCHEDMTALAEQHGFKSVYFSPENLIVARPK